MSFPKPVRETAPRVNTMRRTSMKRRGRVELKCAQCDSPFTIPHCRTVRKEGAGRHCSRQCADLSRRTREEKPCGHCGAPFLAKPSQAKHYKGANQYCSRACSYQGMITKNAGKPIIDRYGRTGRKAAKEWQKAVRERDGYICQRCGKYDPYVHAHHVAPRSRRPDLKYDVANGKCLCNSCHSYTHHHPVEATALGLLSDASYERARMPA